MKNIRSLLSYPYDKDCPNCRATHRRLTTFRVMIFVLVGGAIAAFATSSAVENSRLDLIGYFLVAVELSIAFLIMPPTARELKDCTHPAKPVLPPPAS